MATITLISVKKRVVTVGKKFKVMGVSSNHNRFGLQGFIAVARDGTVLEAAANAINLPKVDSIIKVTVDDAGGVFSADQGWEIPRLLPNCPKHIVKRVWGS